MNTQQDLIFSLMKELEEVLDNGMPLIGNFLVVVKKETANNLMDKIYAALPDEIRDARALLRRKDEVLFDAQQKAEKIITDAQAEASRLLSESDLLRAVQKEAEKIKESVINDCENIRRKALDEAENIRLQALDDASRTKEGANIYAEQVLVNLEQNITQLHEVVKNGQVTLERKRAEAGNYDNVQENYPNKGQNYSTNFKIN